MKCPFCSSLDLQVLDTRNSEEDGSVRRRRRCGDCGKRFTTYERIEINMPMVVKRNGMRMEFDMGRVRSSMRTALRKRPVSIESIEAAILHIQDKILALPSKEITTEVIGQLVMDELKQLDAVAYVRFASVYQSFENINQFMQIIQDLAQPNDNLPHHGQ